MLFVAQLWKYQETTTTVNRRHSFPHSGGFPYRLENKNGDWMYLKETWFLPKPLIDCFDSKLIGKWPFTTETEKSKGHYLRNSLGSVLKANIDNKGKYIVHMHLRLNQITILQILCYTRDCSKVWFLQSVILH